MTSPKTTAARGRAEHALLHQRRPGAVGAALHLAVFLRAGRRGRASRHQRCVEVLAIPQLRAERLLLPHVHVVHALDRLVAQVLHDGAVGTLQIREPVAARRLDALGPGVGDFRLGQSEHAAGGRPGVAADLDRGAFVRGVEREELDLRPAPVGFKGLAHVSHVPAEMPDRRLRRGRRRGGDLAEQQQDVVRRLQRRQAAPARLRRARELPGVEVDRGGGIERVEVQMMEAGRREHLGLSCGGRLRPWRADPREQHRRNHRSRLHERPRVTRDTSRLAPISPDTPSTTLAD